MFKRAALVARFSFLVVAADAEAARLGYFTTSFS
jgi:hypothetical protein